MKKIQRSRIGRKAAICFLMMMLFLLMTPVLCTASLKGATQINLEDGEYSIEVEMEGGSGRAQIVTPAVLMVKDGYAYARIQWSSPNYDYMKVGGEKYFPVNEEGNSTFEIPVTAFGEPMTVIGDTTAMSVPHEVEYTLIFDEHSITSHNDVTVSLEKILPWVFVGILFVGAVTAWIYYRKRKNGKKNE